MDICTLIDERVDFSKTLDWGDWSFQDVWSVVLNINAYMGLSLSGWVPSFEYVQSSLQALPYCQGAFDYIERCGDLRLKSWYMSLAPARSGECDLL